jgi:hypothetical protein
LMTETISTENLSRSLARPTASAAWGWRGKNGSLSYGGSDEGRTWQKC